MRIIQLIGSAGRSGAGRVAFCLGEGLRAAGHQVAYATAPWVIEFFDAPRDGDTFFPLKRFGGFREWLAFNRWGATADLVITHDSPARHFVLIARCLGLKPRLWFMRHCISGTSRFGPVPFYRRLVDHQIAVSDAVYRSLIASGFPRQRTTRIYGGIDLRPFRHPDPVEVERRRRQFLDDATPGTNVIGMTARMSLGPGRGRLRDTKGYGVLFQALARVRFPYRVLFIGPCQPEAQALLRQMAGSLGIQPDHLRFPGFVRDVKNFYPLMTINVLPSHSEGLGLALIEGMAAGAASVGSRAGGMVEIIEDGRTGLLFEPGDHEDLARCLSRLATDATLRGELALRGQASVCKHFDAPVMVQAFGDLLERLQ